MELTPEQIRVLGCLIEKSVTTPDNYPLTTNSLVSACNQKSSRDPKMSLNDRTVDEAMLELRQAGLARTLTTGGRTVKHRHVADEALGLRADALAVLSVLMLRGPQTVGELRTRTERQHRFADLDEVDAALEALAARPDPLVERLDREAGRKEPRWNHCLLDDDAVLRSALDAMPQQAKDFLAQPRLGMIITNADPFPHAVPVWYRWTGTAIELFSKSDRPKNRRLREDPRCSFLVAAERDEPVYWVAVDGEATVTTDGADLAYALAPLYWDLEDPVYAEIFAEWRARPEWFERITITPHRVRHFTG